MDNLAPWELQNQLLWLQPWDIRSRIWWVDSFDSKMQITLSAEQTVHVQPDGQLILGSLDRSAGEPILRQMYPLAGICGFQHRELLTFHHQQCMPAQYPLLRDLWGFWGSMPPGPLWDFYYQVLADRSFIQGFFRARASHHHHHQQEGGLLEHSHEVAKTAAMLAMQHQLDKKTVAIAFLGGLLHDVGKLYLFYNQPVGEGICEQHEALNFMCLQPQLNQLRQRDPRLFEALCGCLTQADSYTASYLPETIVRMADRLSAEVCNWRRAFADMPSFYWYRKSTTDQRIYKRLSD